MMGKERNDDDDVSVVKIKESLFVVQNSGELLELGGFGRDGE